MATMSSGVNTGLIARADSSSAMVEDFALLVPRDRSLQLQHEAVHLGFGQRIGALLLDGVLRGEDQERPPAEGGVADGHLPLLHGLKQRALHLGRGPVDFVGQDDVREDRALLGRELVRSAGL